MEMFYEIIKKEISDNEMLQEMFAAVNASNGAVRRAVIMDKDDIGGNFACADGILYINEALPVYQLRWDLSSLHRDMLMKVRCHANPKMGTKDPYIAAAGLVGTVFHTYENCFYPDSDD